MNIQFHINNTSCQAHLRDTPTAQAIAAVLPITAKVQTWGNEIYFPLNKCS